MSEPERQFLAALDRGDAEATRLALHPYVRWTSPDGTVIFGRRRVLDMLATRGRLEEPLSVQVRDGQIYRWTEPERYL